ncbi:hypothetical protein [Dolichospermum sp. UHCC 0259]|uniref:hypothetical protein n=1 Tax=Dolichospermum sp. UHCC 0259 TaxID=2590010 RepID=UPI001444DDA1|nr:hypothetical protein [Dolichospermum sp. UHCC 0259]
MNIGFGILALINILAQRDRNFLCYLTDTTELVTGGKYSCLSQDLAKSQKLKVE